jgi:hypothetical protein
MRTNACRLSFSLFWVTLLVLPLQTAAHQTDYISDENLTAVLPDAPVPNIEITYAESSSNAWDQAAQQFSNGVNRSSSMGQNVRLENRRQEASEQIKQQEHQRIAGIIPSFNVSYLGDAVSMSAKQKMSLAFRSAVDPFTFAAGFVAAGYREVRHDDPGFGWGSAGYFKRSGAAYLDTFDATMIGNGILPALLREDPRYFRLGHGSVMRRILYAMFSNVACKQDKSRKWGPNIAGVGGNIIAGYISNLYYPSQGAGWGRAVDNGMLVTAEGNIATILNEFWPDISRKLFHKNPTDGQDTAMRDADKMRQENQNSQ